jgi:Transglutaminase-like superfamily
MLTPLPFTLHASLGCPAHADLAVSLAWELSDLDGHELECGLDVLAAATLTDLSADPRTRLTALGEPVTAGALRPRRHGGVRDLLIGDVVGDGRGHPTALAVVLVEVARRAGIDVGIVAAGAPHYVADLHSDEPWLLDPATGHVVDATRLDGELTWRCAHQVVAVLLDLAQPRYERIGDLRHALRVAELRCALPFDDESKADARARFRRLASRLN